MKIILRHTLSLLFSAWFAVTLVFIALRALPGDAIEAQLQVTGFSEADIQRQRELYGLDEPLPVQYVDYWRDLAQANLGQSLISREPVREMIRARLMPTLTLAGLGLLAALLMGLLMGIGAVLPQILEERRTIAILVKYLCASLMTFALAAPVYWTATLVIYFVSNQLSLLPSGGNSGRNALILPVLVLGFHTGGAIARVSETALREVLQQPFIQTARAKGLPPRQVLGHALRVGLLPVLSITALQAGFLLSGTVIIEFMFTRRGLGRLMFQAVQDQDYPVVQGLVLISTLAYTFTRILADVLRQMADPRVRHA